MASGELTKIVEMMGTTYFDTTMVLLCIVIVGLVLTIGFEEEDFYDMFGSMPDYAGRSQERLVPVVKYTPTGGGAYDEHTTYATYKDYVTNFDFEWLYIRRLKEFGWVEKPKPQVSMILSPGMQEKIDKILKNKEDSA